MQGMFDFWDLVEEDKITIRRVGTLIHLLCCSRFSITLVIPFRFSEFHKFCLLFLVKFSEKPDDLASLRFLKRKEVKARFPFDFVNIDSSCFPVRSLHTQSKKIMMKRWINICSILCLASKAKVPDIVGDGGRCEGHGDPSEAWVGGGDVFQNDHYNHLEIIKYYEHQYFEFKLLSNKQGPRLSIRMIIWIFCSDTLCCWQVLLLFQLS